MKAYLKMQSEDIVSEIEKSGIRGRGGGGFPTGFKWKMALKEKSDKKYVICNGDEGDPGAFMDRSLFEGTPHSVIEGMMIAARAIGADEGYIYIRMEYPLAVKRIRKAVKEAEALGILGENIFGSGYDFKINVMEGAGAFVCGEETALMASVEGKRGMPMPKPPFPSESGLFGKPSVINNVETLATVPDIILKGADEFRKVGTENSPGTKTFALTGHVANTGLIEVPFGTTLRKIIFDIGGGVIDKDGKINNKAFKAVQIGGPSGGCLTEKHLDEPLDFDNIKKLNAMIGSGGLVVMNDSTCMIRIAKYFMEFTQEESCGKCVLCREGTKQMLNLLEDITEGNATMETLETLKELGDAICKGSLCGLGKTAPNPVLSTMEQFEEEYLAHVRDKICPTRECSALSLPEINQELCKGCTLCARKCPVDAISGKVKEAHVIDPEKCINCGTCIEVCKFNAIA
jgi:NADH-quinone oxidoreductase subunit F